MTFFLDLWHDLREKRLWPVAVGLLAAAIAIPVVMLKPAGDPAPAPVIAADSGEAETLPAVNVDTAPVHGSKLETFSTRNPFKPLNDLKKEDVPSDGTTGSGGGGATAGGGDSGGTTTGGGGSLPSGDGGSGSGSSGGTTPTTPTTPSGSELKWYRYAVDVKFGTPTRQKTLKDVARLEALPAGENPAVIFMGVTDDAETALFLIVDDSLVADGEGSCRDEGTCRIVELTVDGGSDEESFTSTDGTVQYDLQLLKIRREEMDAPSSSQSKEAADEPSEKRIARTTGTAVGAISSPEVLSLETDPDVALADE